MEPGHRQLMGFNVIEQADEQTEVMSTWLYRFVAMPPRVLSADSDDVSGFVRQPTEILKLRLAALGAEAKARLSIHGDHAELTASECRSLDDEVVRVARLVDYGQLDPQQLSELQRHRADLQKERRKEDVECWRDLTALMKDFLDTWDSLERARGLALTMDHAGRPAPEYL